MKRLISILNYPMMMPIFFVLFGFILLTNMGWLWHSNPSSKMEPLQALELEGAYTSTEDESPKDLKTMDVNQVSKMSQVVIKGHFNQTIPKGESIWLFLYQLHAKVYLNNKPVYQYKYRDAAQNNHQAGIDWGEFESPGISPDDWIEIRLESLADNHYNGTYIALLNNFYAGSRYALIQHQLIKDSPFIVMGILIIIMGITGLVAMLTQRAVQTTSTKGFVSGAILMICGAICSLINYDYITLIFPNAYVVSNVDNLTQLLIGYFLIIYLQHFLYNHKHIAISNGMIIFFGVLVLISQWHAGVTTEGAISITWVHLAIAMSFSIIIEVMIVLENRTKLGKRLTLQLISSVVLIICTFVEAIHYAVAGIFWIKLFEIVLFLFSSCQLFILLDYVHESIKKAQRIERMEKEMAESRLAITLSQIQPHFLYNSLTVIAQLCDKDPATAKKATINFSRYLRGNLDSIQRKQSIDFNAELKHIEIYLSLEKLRFGDRLNIEYDIGPRYFLVPSLGIQPIVENAVRYGVCQKEEGGTVVLRTEEDDKEIRVIIEDDGVGFDPKQTKDDGRTHIGIDNVRQRIENQRGGRLEIQSNKGVGTTAVIHLPKQNKYGEPY